MAPVAVGLAYGAWAVSLPPFSGVATAAVLAGGGAALLWGVAGRSRSDVGRAGPGLGARWPWAALAVATAAWQLAAYLQHPRADHPTLSSLANDLLDSHPARAVAFTAWLAVASWLVRR